MAPIRTLHIAHFDGVNLNSTYKIDITTKVSSRQYLNTSHNYVSMRSKDGKIAVFDFKGLMLPIFEIKDPKIKNVALYEHFIVLDYEDGYIDTYDILSKQKVFTIKKGDGEFDVKVSGDYLITCDGTILSAFEFVLTEDKVEAKGKEEAHASIGSIKAKGALIDADEGDDVVGLFSLKYTPMDPPSFAGVHNGVTYVSIPLDDDDGEVHMLYGSDGYEYIVPNIEGLDGPLGDPFIFEGKLYCHYSSGLIRIDEKTGQHELVVEDIRELAVDSLGDTMSFQFQKDGNTMGMTSNGDKYAVATFPKPVLQYKMYGGIIVVKHADTLAGYQMTFSSEKVILGKLYELPCNLNFLYLRENLNENFIGLSSEDVLIKLYDIETGLLKHQYTTQDLNVDDASFQGLTNQGFLIRLEGEDDKLIHFRINADESVTQTEPKEGWKYFDEFSSSTNGDFIFFTNEQDLYIYNPKYFVEPGQVPKATKAVKAETPVQLTPLTPLKPKVDHLKQLLDNSEKYIKTLTQESKDVVINYTGINYKKLNKCLRKIKVGNDKCDDELAELDRVLANGPVTSGELTLFRSFNGFDNAAGTKLMNKLQNVPIGGIFEERGFMSTAYGKPAAGFVGSKCCAMKIKVPPGTKALAVESVSNHSEEREVLLMAGMGLRKTGESVEDGRVVYEFDCKYCGVSDRFRQSVAPSTMINTGQYKTRKDEMTPTKMGYQLPKPLPDTTRFVMALVQGDIKAKELKNVANAVSATTVIAFNESGAAMYNRETKELKPAQLSDSLMIGGIEVVDIIVEYSTTYDEVTDIIDQYDENTQPIFVRGMIDEEGTEVLLVFGFKEISRTGQFGWYARNANILPVFKQWSFDNGNVLIVDIMSPTSKLRASTLKAPSSVSGAKSKRIYGLLGNPTQLEKHLGCGLFTDSCINSFKNYDTNAQFEVKQPLKGQIILARHLLCKIVGKEVVFPALAKMPEMPYLISGTTAINYWIQTLAGGKEYNLPIIPTEDFDIKVDMKYSKDIEIKIQEELAPKKDRILQILQSITDIDVANVEYKWIGTNDMLRRLMAIMIIPELQKAVGQPLMFPIVEFSSPTGIKNVGSVQIMTPYGVYLAKPEYIRDDMCKGWGQSYKAKRRIAKMNYWNIVFPAGHRLHQNQKFNEKGSVCL